MHRASRLSGGENADADCPTFDGAGVGEYGAGVSGADAVKVAIGQIDTCANQAPTLGMKAGIFQKHGIALETFGTQGAGETLQAVISGSADKLAPLQLSEWPRGIAWRMGNDQA